MSASIGQGPVLGVVGLRRAAKKTGIPVLPAASNHLYCLRLPAPGEIESHLSVFQQVSDGLGEHRVWVFMQ